MSHIHVYMIIYIIYTYNLHMYRNRQYIICDTQLFTPSRNTGKTEESADCQ